MAIYSSIKNIIYYIVIICIISCSDNNIRLEQALQVSSENRLELERVLHHYKNDSLKLEAAKYLISNMPYHFFLDEYYVSPLGKKYRPDISFFGDSDRMKNHCDSLIASGYRVVQNRKKDIQVIDSAYLVSNIELAFSVRNKPWNKNVSFKDFCRYILPYRAQIEAPSSLRKYMMDRFMPFLDSANVNSTLDACILLNKHLKTIIKYQDTGLTFYPTTDETYYSGISRCEGLCDLGTLIMRSVGIPVAVDMTTWVKMDLGHSWCVVLNEGKFYSFGPGEDQPIEHAKSFSKIRHRRPAKVYRSRFDPKFHKSKIKDDGYVTFLKSPLLYDVIDEYLDTPINITVETDKFVREKRISSQVYLCVYNFYEWKPLAIGKINDTTCTFDKVVGDNVFIVADSPDSKTLRFITAPFYVDISGKIHKFIPNIQQDSLTLGKREGKEHLAHTLFYWDINEQDFIRLEYEQSSDSTQFYSAVPTNALFWFTVPERIVNQRVFFIENDSIKKY